MAKSVASGCCGQAVVPVGTGSYGVKGSVTFERCVFDETKEFIISRPVKFTFSVYGDRIEIREQESFSFVIATIDLATEIITYENKWYPKYETPPEVKKETERLFKASSLI